MPDTLLVAQLKAGSPAMIPVGCTSSDDHTTYMVEFHYNANDTIIQKIGKLNFHEVLCVLETTDIQQSWLPVIVVYHNNPNQEILVCQFVNCEMIVS